jgi:hypothetical protein
MFRVTFEGDQKFMHVMCDNGRCWAQAHGQVPPAAPEQAAVMQFCTFLVQSHGWLIVAGGAYCPEHKHAYMEPEQRSLIVPAVQMPPKMRNGGHA